MNFVNKLDKAAERAVVWHSDQTRKDCSLPYVTHCFDVMKRVAHYGVTDEDILAAAILHDTVEDCGIDKRDIAMLFGLRTAYMVVQCSRPQNQKTAKQKLEWMRGFEQKTTGSIIIKIADRFCNVTDFLAAGKTKYAMWYNLQAYPLYEAYFKREHKVSEELRAGIRADIYAYNQQMQMVLGHSLNYIEVAESKDNLFQFDHKAIDKLLIKGL